MADILQDDDKDIVEGENIENEDELESASAEPDFAPTASAPVFDDEDDTEADPHSSFDEHTSVVEDPHQEDIYGDAGAPLGYDEDEEEEIDEEEYSDSDSY